MDLFYNKNIMRRFIPISLILVLWSITIFAQQESAITDPDLKFSATAEIGFLGVLSHNIQFSQNGTDLNYVKDGGQDVLYPVNRLSLEMALGKKHTFIFLYQPLRIESEQLLTRDLVIDNETFPANTGVRFLYNFPFYRASWLRELLPENPDYKLALGISAQIRNATITFESIDGTKFRKNSDIGFVPILKLRSTANFTDKFFGEIEADGFYAPISYLNGSDEDIIGSILDASARLGYRIHNNVTAFSNIRYLGGGAVGTNTDDEGPGDGYVKNWLNFMTVSAGFTYSFE